jgi:hypothetical protein
MVSLEKFLNILYVFCRLTESKVVLDLVWPISNVLFVGLVLAMCCLFLSSYSYLARIETL